MAPWWKASLAALLLWPSAVLATPEPREDLARRICAATEAQATAQGLEAGFLARLLWRESLFDPSVVSPKGAMGIAQFMPGTAAQRGLADPFEPIAAVTASAAYLAELEKTFGNIGLAAAAYNAGEQRVSDWLAGKAGLPAETRDYVAFITGHSAEEWQKPAARFALPSLGPAASFAENCLALATRRQAPAGRSTPSGAYRPWGAVLAVNFSEARALAMFQRLKLRFPQALANRDPLILRKRNLSRGTRALSYVMLGEASQAAATATCRQINEAGAPCLVRKN